MTKSIPIEKASVIEAHKPTKNSEIGSQCFIINTGIAIKGAKISPAAKKKGLSSKPDKKFHIISTPELNAATTES